MFVITLFADQRVMMRNYEITTAQRWDGIAERKRDTRHVHIEYDDDVNKSKHVLRRDKDVCSCVVVVCEV